jgi:hypothetical protein
MSRGPGELQRWLLSWLTQSAEEDGMARWFAVGDLTGVRLQSLSGSTPTIGKLDIEGMRRAARRLQRNGLIELQECPCPGVRNVSSPDADNPVRVKEERPMLCVRLAPTTEQQYAEALDDVEHWQEKVKRHPGWRWGERELERARKEADRLRGRLAAGGVD